jgi:hypothetical protein
MIKIRSNFIAIEVCMSVLKSLVCLFVLAASFAFAAPKPSSFPRGCEASGFTYGSTALVLNEFGAQSYYLIQNKSQSPLELVRLQSSEDFMSPPLHVTLDPQSWGAFASDVKELNFRCFRKEAGNETTVSCSEVLDICRYPRVRFALSNMGNYWISANKSQREVIQDSVNKGIYLKW